MGLYKSSVTKTDGSREVAEYYAYTAQQAAECHQKAIELFGGEVKAQKVVPSNEKQ